MTQPLRLFWSSRSPFARKVMIAAHEMGLAGRIETIAVVVGATKLNPEVMARNPLNKIPTLLAGERDVIFDSRVICEYLDSLHAGPKLFPAEPARRWQTLRREAEANGIMENGILLMGERARPEAIRSQAHTDAFRAKVLNALDHLDREAPANASLPLDIGHVTLGAALSYLDFRFGHESWREGRPRLTAWYREFSRRPSMVATEFVDA